MSGLYSFFQLLKRGLFPAPVRLQFPDTYQIAGTALRQWDYLGRPCSDLSGIFTRALLIRIRHSYHLLA